MEPITLTAILAGLAGAASKKIIDEAWVYGKKWLDNYFKDHSKNVRETAEKNSLAFLNDLALRVQKIEDDVKDSKKAKEFLEKKFNDPDFAATLHSALIVSARTSSEYKHKILGRIVAERLQSHNQSLTELSSSMAVDAIQYLGEKHISALGVIAIVQNIRPDKKDFHVKDTAQFPEWYTNWLNNNLSWVSKDFELSYYDYMHLMSVSCLDYGFVGSKNLKEVLEPQLSYQKTHPWSSDSFLSSELGKRIVKWWEDGMKKTNLTTSGMLIGVYVVDHKTGTKTRIDW